MRYQEHLSFCKIFISALLTQSCSTLFNLPANGEKSTLGEITPVSSELSAMPLPKEKIVVGVYKFRDQTGQYKASETGSNWSTAVPQGTTTILIKALEDSHWFIPIERENIANLLNERQIIRSTRQEYAKDSEKNNQLPPLLYAGILLEGGIISYDTNVMTGGIGARYFGLGASTQYRQDRITVYLRAVSTLNGEILKTVYTSKNILSTSVSGNFFRFIDTERLLESEVGITQNEPVQLAVTEAIEKAVKTLIIEGIDSKIWGKAIDGSEKDYQEIVNQYKTETIKNENRLLGNKYGDSKRENVAVSANAEGIFIHGDLINPEITFGGKFGLKFFFTKHFNVGVNFSNVTVENASIFKGQYYGPDLNLEYLFFPNYRLSPFVYAGGGALFSKFKPFYKAQIGGGLDFLMTKDLALNAYAQYDLGFGDRLDRVISGRQNDNLVRVGLGLTFYFNSNQKKKP